MPPPAIARWCSWPGPGYSGKPPDILQTNVIREWSGGRLPISKILLFKTYSCSVIEKWQGAGNALPAMQNGIMQGEEFSKGSIADYTLRTHSRLNSWCVIHKSRLSL